MKKLIILTLIMFIGFCHFTFAQWQGTNPVWFNAGYVGIGTSTPSSLLEINTTNTAISSIKLTYGGYPRLSQRIDGTWNYFEGQSGQGHRFTTAGTDFVIHNNGNVGVGLIDPIEKLTIQGNLQFGGSSTSITNFYLKTYDGSSTANNGNGRNFIISAGSSDNQTGKRGGNLHLRPGSPAAPATAYGNIYLVDEGGNVGIGVSGTGMTTNPNGYKLAVKGKIGAQEVQVENTSSTWVDYVFESDYKLMPLQLVESYIKTNKHLPEIPSKKEVEENGHKLGEMDVLLLKKVEELTLYIIQQNKKIQDLTERLQTLESEK